VHGVIRFRYSISLGPDGQLRRGGIFVPIGARQNTILLSVDLDGRWTVNGKPRPDLEKCGAFDIMDTPFPKRGLVKSLGLEEGGERHIWVAYIDNRHLLFSPVEQQWKCFPSDRKNLQHYQCEVLDATSDYYFDESLLVQFSPERSYQDRANWCGFGDLAYPPCLGKRTDGFMLRRTGPDVTLCGHIEIEKD
jgi:hypothetical protein